MVQCCMRVDGEHHFEAEVGKRVGLFRVLFRLCVLVKKTNEREIEQKKSRLEVLPSGYSPLAESAS